MTAVDGNDVAGQFLPTNSHVKGDGESNGNETPSSRKTFCRRLKNFVRCRKTFIIAGSIILNVILACTLAVRKNEICPAPLPSTCEANPCLNGWVGYNRKCYYFAETEGDWMFSKNNCSTLNASLALVDSQEEMNFMLRYKGSADHWLGLQKNPEQTWKWINGSFFNEMFPLRGGGNCAYLNHEGIASSSCRRQERWICSKQPRD